MVIRTATGRGQLWSSYSPRMHSMQSSEQRCWRAVQPGCQGWLKDIFNTGVFLTESNFPARSTTVALFFLKRWLQFWEIPPFSLQELKYSLHSTSQRASCRSSTCVSCNTPHVCSMTPQRYTFINKVVGRGVGGGSSCYCYSDRLTPAGDSWIRRAILHPGVSPSLINLFVPSGHAKCNAAPA